MAQSPTSGGGPNQTLLELIFSLKGLAQTVEFYHQDLSRRLDAEGKTRAEEIQKLRDILSQNVQAVTVLPITFSTRMEKVIDDFERDLSKDIENIQKALQDVKDRLEGYSRTAERAISQHDGTVEETKEPEGEVTGRIEIRKDGEVRVSLNSKLMKKMWYALIVMAAGGGVYGLKELIHAIFG